MPTAEPRASSNSVIAGLHPASFAIVMATGVVSIAAQLRGFAGIAQSLMWLNVVCYGVLWVLTLIRVARFRSQVAADLWDHNRSVGFFAICAATCVLGNQFIVVECMPRVAIGLWFLGIVLWAASTYVIFTILTVKAIKPSVEEGLNGGWLVAVVAAQAVATLGGLVAPYLGAGREAALFFSLVVWLGGGMLYIWIISLIFYRYTFLPLDPRQLAPPYWINMGAMAISTLAGTLLVSNAPQSPLLTMLSPFLLGLTLLFWATATWWIPLLVALGVWRHLICRVPLAYDVVYWSAVFPLGMYTVCTHRLSAVTELHWLDVVPKYFVFIALAAWALTFFGLLRKMLIRTARI
jgi:tellurite resistance protein TehA-like permease